MKLTNTEVHLVYSALKCAVVDWSASESKRATQIRQAEKLLAKIEKYAIGNNLK